MRFMSTVCFLPNSLKASVCHNGGWRGRDLRARNNSPRGHHNFVTAKLHRLREGRLLARLHIVGKAVHVLNRAMLLCKGSHLRNLRVFVDLSLCDRHDEAVDILL